jgi:hypothetical protein
MHTCSYGFPLPQYSFNATFLFFCFSIVLFFFGSQFYEYGWGDSFHFGWRKKGEPHVKSIQNSQNFVAQKLQVKDMDRVIETRRLE